MLYVLLGAIGVLLALLVTLLPEEPSSTREAELGPDAGRVVDGDRDGAGDGARVATGTAEDGTEGAAQERVESAGERSDGEAREVAPPDRIVTERYPEEEVPPVSEAAAAGEELWWLPEGPAEGTPLGKLYLILDDAGNAMDPLPVFLEFPGPLAVAVLPQLAHSVESAAHAAAAGKEIMLHLPMEAVGGADPGPGAITSHMNDSDILRTIGVNLGSVPGAIGMNNHMGSAGTADPRLMELVLAEARRRDIFFVDSRTTVDTVARRVAAYIGTPFAERHVFLDNTRTRDAILGAIRQALLLAHSQEHVVMIGHATVPELASVLLEIYPVLSERGYEFGAISEIVAPPAIGSESD